MASPTWWRTRRFTTWCRARRPTRRRSGWWTSPTTAAATTTSRSSSCTSTRARPPRPGPSGHARAEEADPALHGPGGERPLAGGAEVPPDTALAGARRLDRRRGRGRIAGRARALFRAAGVGEREPRPQGGERPAALPDPAGAGEGGPHLGHARPGGALRRQAPNRGDGAARPGEEPGARPGAARERPWGG